MLPGGLVWRESGQSKSPSGIGREPVMEPQGRMGAAVHEMIDPEGSAISRPVPLHVALLYDMDACRSPTGVTRHALAQLHGLARRPGVALSVVTGRMSHPDGLACWESLERQNRYELPVRTRNMLRWWRLKSWPPIEWWTGPVDWVYCPAEFLVATRQARRAVTSHDVWQTLQFEPPRKRDLLGRVFEHADLVLSVSHFNTQRLLEAFPACREPRGLRTQWRRRSVLRAGDRSRASWGP